MASRTVAVAEHAELPTLGRGVPGVGSEKLQLETPSLGLAQQPTQERQEHFAGEATLQDLKAQGAPVGER